MVVVVVVVVATMRGDDDYSPMIFLGYPLISKHNLVQTWGHRGRVPCTRRDLLLMPAITHPVLSRAPGYTGGTDTGDKSACTVRFSYLSLRSPQLTKMRASIYSTI